MKSKVKETWNFKIKRHGKIMDLTHMLLKNCIDSIKNNQLNRKPGLNNKKTAYSALRFFMVSNSW